MRLSWNSGRADGLSPLRLGPRGNRRRSGGRLNQHTTDANQGQDAPRRPYPKRADERGKRRLSGPAVVSIILHVVVGAALLRVLLIPHALNSLFAKKDLAVEPERISFLALPQTAEPPSPGRSGGNNRPITTPRTTAPAAPLVAPTEVPSTLPPVSPTPAAPTATDDEGTGPLIGRGGPTRGVRPS